jgi:large subunit ribosomal protein L29
MKNTEIKSLSKDQIIQKIDSERELLAKLKFANAISPIENPMRIKHSRRLIAKLLTELSTKA